MVHLEERILVAIDGRLTSAIGTWPVCTARLISDSLKSEPLERTVISSRPLVACLISSANALALRVWKRDFA